MIDDTPDLDFPLDFIMITLNSVYVSLDLYKDFFRKLKRESIKQQNQRNFTLCADFVVSFFELF
jgi:hypothetical protein